MRFLWHNTEEDTKPGSWKIVTIGYGKRQRKSVCFTCPNGHTYLLDRYEILPTGGVHPIVLCPADDCNFHEFIRLKEWKHKHRHA